MLPVLFLVLLALPVCNAQAASLTASVTAATRTYDCATGRTRFQYTVSVGPSKDVATVAFPVCSSIVTAQVFSCGRRSAAGTLLASSVPVGGIITSSVGTSGPAAVFNDAHSKGTSISYCFEVTGHWGTAESFVNDQQIYVVGTSGSVVRSTYRSPPCQSSTAPSCASATTAATTTATTAAATTSTVATQVDGTVTASTRTYDCAAQTTTWCYTLQISATSRDLSHVTWGLCDALFSAGVQFAGLYDTNGASVGSSAGFSTTTSDPTSGTKGAKFDHGQTKGTTLRYCFKAAGEWTGGSSYTEFSLKAGSGAGSVQYHTYANPPGCTRTAVAPTCTTTTTTTTAATTTTTTTTTAAATTTTAAATTTTAAATSTTAAATTTTAATNNRRQPITICHRTASCTNPYVKITVDQDAADGGLDPNADRGRGDHYNEHLSPTDDRPPVFNASYWTPSRCQDEADRKVWGDIIPPIPGVHSGRNWWVNDDGVTPHAGQIIYNNDCQPTSGTPCPASSGSCQGKNQAVRVSGMLSSFDALQSCFEYEVAVASSSSDIESIRVNNPLSLALQWKDCVTGAAIEGATGAEFVFPSALVAGSTGRACLCVAGSCSGEVSTVSTGCGPTSQCHDAPGPDKCNGPPCLPAVTRAAWTVQGVGLTLLHTSTIPASGAASQGAIAHPVPRGWRLAQLNSARVKALLSCERPCQCVVGAEGQGVNPTTGLPCAATITTTHDGACLTTTGCILIEEDGTDGSNDFLGESVRSFESGWVAYNEADTARFGPSPTGSATVNAAARSVTLVNDVATVGYVGLTNTFVPSAPFTQSFRVCAIATGGLSRVGPVNATTDADFAVYFDLDVSSTLGQQGVTGQIATYLAFTPSANPQRRCRNFQMPSQTAASKITTSVFIRNYRGSATISNIEISASTGSLLADGSFDEENSFIGDVLPTPGRDFPAYWRAVTPLTTARFSGDSLSVRGGSPTGYAAVQQRIPNYGAHVTKVTFGACAVLRQDSAGSRAFLKLDVIKSNGETNWAKGLIRFDELASVGDRQCVQATVAVGGQPLELVVEALVKGESTFEFDDIWAIGDSNCPETGNTATHGDPHMITLDGLSYDLQTVGEFELTSDSELSVQIRHAQAGATSASVNAALALRYKGMTLQVERGEGTALPTLTVNGVVTTYDTKSPVALWDTTLTTRVGAMAAYGVLEPSTTRPFTMVIGFPSTSHTVTVVSRVSKFNVQYLMVLVDFPVTSAKAVRGLLGNLDGDAKNDMQSKEGIVFDPKTITFVERYKVFAESWRTTPSTSLFTYPAGRSHADFNDASFPASEPQFTAEQIAKADEVCSAKQLAEDLHDACVFDFIMTGDETFVAGIETLTSVHGFQKDFVTATSEDSGTSTGAAIGIGIAVGVAVAIGIIVAAVLIRRHHKKQAIRRTGTELVDAETETI